MTTRNHGHRVGALAAGHIAELLHLAGAAVTHVGGDADYGVDLHVQMPESLDLEDEWSMAPRYIHVQVKGRTKTNPVQVNQDTIDSWQDGTVPTVVIVCRSSDWSIQTRRSIEVCFPWQLPTVSEGKETAVVKSSPLKEHRLVEGLHVLSFLPKFLLAEPDSGLNSLVAADPAALVIRTFFAQQLLQGKPLFVPQLSDIGYALEEVGMDQWETDAAMIWSGAGEQGVWDFGHKNSATSHLVGPTMACTSSSTLDYGTIIDAELLKVATNLRASENYTRAEGISALSSLAFLRHLFNA